MSIYSNIAGVLQDIFTIGINDVLTVSVSNNKTVISVPNDSAKALVITSADSQTPFCTFNLPAKIFDLSNMKKAKIGSGDDTDIYFEANVLSNIYPENPAIRYSTSNLSWQYSNDGENYQNLLALGPITEYSGSATTAARTDHTHSAADIGLGNISNTAQITSVSASYPLLSTGGTTPSLSIPEATIYTAGYMSIDDKTKLNGIELRANNYTHPVSHAPSIITQDSLNRFVSDSQISTWDSKEDVLSFSIGLTRSNNSVSNNLLVGVNGGQTIIGGSNSSDSLTLRSTSSVMRGFIVCEDDLKAKSLISGKVDEIVVDGGVVVDGLLVKDGTVKIGDPHIESPLEDDVGKLRYYKNGQTSYCDMVMQVDETTFKWVNLFTNNW